MWETSVMLRLCATQRMTQLISSYPIITLDISAVLLGEGQSVYWFRVSLTRLKLHSIMTVCF